VSLLVDDHLLWRPKDVEPFELGLPCFALVSDEKARLLEDDVVQYLGFRPVALNEVSQEAILNRIRVLLFGLVDEQYQTLLLLLSSESTWHDLIDLLAQE
jgi:hypothetical protein